MREWKTEFPFLVEARHLSFYVRRMLSRRPLDRSSKLLVTATFMVQWTGSAIPWDTITIGRRSLSYNDTSLSMLEHELVRD